MAKSWDVWKKIYFDMKFHVPFKLATDFKICISKLGCFDGNSLIHDAMVWSPTCSPLLVAFIENYLGVD